MKIYRMFFKRWTGDDEIEHTLAYYKDFQVLQKYVNMLKIELESSVRNYIKSPITWIYRSDRKAWYLESDKTGQLLKAIYWDEIEVIDE